MILGLLSLIESFVFELFTDQSIALFEVEIIPCVTLPATVIDHGQPSYVFDSSPFRLIMSPSDPLQSGNGVHGTPDDTDVSNEIQISGVADFSRERTKDIQFGMIIS